MRFFDIAARLSKKAQYCHKLGAVVVHKNRPIGFGFNKPHKSHPRSLNKYNNIHAELDSILGLSYNELDGADIYIYRQTKDGKPALAKPCSSCMELLKKVGIKTICYTCNDGYKEELI